METSGHTSARRNRHTLSRCISVLFLLSLAGLGIAQEVEGNGRGSGAIVSPADYMEITTPVTSHVAVNTYGFYLGNLRTSIALLEVPTTVQKHFTVTPGYLFVNVSAERRARNPSSQFGRMGVGMQSAGRGAENDRDC